MFRIKKNYKQKVYTAFTLAEVLITLGIIGIVAAIVIPIIMNSNNQIEQFRTQIKKQYSIFDEAIKLLASEDGSIDTSSDANFISQLSKRIKIIQQGQWGNLTTLPTNFNYKCYKEPIGTCGDLIKRPTNDTLSAFITNDGTLVIFLAGMYPNCDGINHHARIADSDALHINNSCGTLVLDVNGDKSPNQLGVDAHLFYLLKKNNDYYFIPLGYKYTSSDCQAGQPNNYNASIHCVIKMLSNETMP